MNIALDDRKAKTEKLISEMYKIIALKDSKKKVIRNFKTN